MIFVCLFVLLVSKDIYLKHTGDVSGWLLFVSELMTYECWGRRCRIRRGGLVKPGVLSEWYRCLLTLMYPEQEELKRFSLIILMRLCSRSQRSGTFGLHESADCLRTAASFFFKTKIACCCYIKRLFFISVSTVVFDVHTILYSTKTTWNSSQTVTAIG